MRMLLLAAGAVALAAAPSQNYISGIEEWRADREARLKTPDGWLSVAGPKQNILPVAITAGEIKYGKH